MTAPVFFAAAAGFVAGEIVELSGAEGRHAARVMRLRPGESVVLTDGAGRSAHGAVDTVGRDQLTVKVDRVQSHPRPAPRLVVVQAVAKGDRSERAVELLTELGVDVVVPWTADRSIVRWTTDRELRALERWRSTARESAKQSRRIWWPEVADVAHTADVVRLVEAAAFAVVLHEEATASISDIALPVSGDVVVVVGPEGGLTPAELDAFGNGGAVACRLGPTVLRTSTAGAAAAAVLLARTIRW